MHDSKAWVDCIAIHLSLICITVRLGWTDCHTFVSYLYNSKAKISVLTLWVNELFYFNCHEKLVSSNALLKAKQVPSYQHNHMQEINWKIHLCHSMSYDQTAAGEVLFMNDADWNSFSLLKILVLVKYLKRW